MRMRFFTTYIIAFLGMAYVFVVGFLFKRQRNLIYIIGNHFGYSTKIKTQLKQDGIANILKAVPEITIASSEGVDGNISLYELNVISMISKLHARNNVFEIGTFDGRTTLHLALNSPINCCIFTLDLPAKQIDEVKYPLATYEKVYVNKPVSGSRFLGHPLSSKIKQMYGDSATFDFSPYHNLCDIVFVDGSHAYEYVLNDTVQAIKLLTKEGGIILWHDCGIWNGVTQFMNAFNQKFPNKLVQVNGTSIVFSEFNKDDIVRAQTVLRQFEKSN